MLSIFLLLLSPVAAQLLWHLWFLAALLCHCVPGHQSFSINGIFSRLFIFHIECVHWSYFLKGRRLFAGYSRIYVWEIVIDEIFLALMLSHCASLTRDQSVIIIQRFSFIEMEMIMSCKSYHLSVNIIWNFQMESKCSQKYKNLSDHKDG